MTGVENGWNGRRWKMSKDKPMEKLLSYGLEKMVTWFSSSNWQKWVDWRNRACRLMGYSSKIPWGIYYYLYFLCEETKAWRNNKTLLVSGKPRVQMCPDSRSCTLNHHVMLLQGNVLTTFYVPVMEKGWENLQCKFSGFPLGPVERADPLRADALLPYCSLLAL